MSKTPKTRRISGGKQPEKRRPTRKTTKKPKRVAIGAAAKTSARRSGTKQAILIELLSRPKGATIEQMTTKTGWRAHSVRGAISGTLKKQRRLTVTAAVVEARGRVYRITGGR